MSNVQNSQYYNIETEVDRKGFTPELFTAIAGSYASNAAYGVGASLVNNYGSPGSNSILSRGSTTVSISGAGFPFVTSVTGCDIRHHDKNVEFACDISIGGVNPAFAALDELRIRPVPPMITQPSRWAVPFPLPLPTETVVFDVEIVDAATGADILPPANSVVRARLLANGFLALFFLNTVTLVETAITNAWLGAAMGAAIVININIKGKYLCNSIPN